MARQSPASPFLPSLPPPPLPPASEPVVIIALQTAFIISINLCWLRHGVMRRPARLSTCDSPPRENEGVREKKVQRGWREMRRGRELKRKRVIRTPASTTYAHTQTHTHTCTHAYTTQLQSEAGSTFRHYILLGGSSLEKEESLSA